MRDIRLRVLLAEDEKYEEKGGVQGIPLHLLVPVQAQSQVVI